MGDLDGFIQLAGASLFEGIAADDLASLLQRLERRSFPSGATVMAEGDCLAEMYIVESGVAEVFITDRDAVDHLINRVGPGGTLGEIALITGQPHSATVRAASPLEVVVVAEADFRDTAVAFPEIYRNVAKILSRRLVNSNRQAMRTASGRATLLVDRDAPPLLGYALACSLAWHTRSAVLLLRIDDNPPPLEWSALAHMRAAPVLSVDSGDFEYGHTDGQAVNPAHAYGVSTTPQGAFAPGMLGITLEHLSHQYSHILLQTPPEFARAVSVRRQIQLVGRREHASPDGEYVLCGWTQTPNRIPPNRERVLSIPAPDEAEQAQLQHGLLPTTGRAGKALGWAARDIAGLKVGVAVGSGALRGFAHIGALRLFDRIGLPVDYLAGTSVGAAVASLYALGHPPDQIARALEATAPFLFRLTMPTRGLLSSAGLERKLRSIGGNARFEDLHIPLGVTATDINTRRTVLFRTGFLWPAVLASMSIPGVYPAQTIGNYTLVDGAVMDPIPSHSVATMGADVVVAIRLAGAIATTPQEAESVVPSGQGPGVLDVIMRSLEIMQSNIPAGPADVPTIVIAPSFKNSRGMGLRNFHEGSRFIEVGEAAAEASLPRLAAAIPWLRG